MDYFSALNIFHSVAETENFSVTAKKLGLAVSSVTRQIYNLENNLGVVLFNRSTRKVALTNVGLRYLNQTKMILEDLQRANLSIKQDVSQPEGKLRITFPPAYGAKKLALPLTEFALKYPKIRLEMYASDDFVDLNAERFDLAVRLGRIIDPNLVARRVAFQKRLLCASPDYLAKYGTPFSPSDLVNHNCLLFEHRGYAPNWYFNHVNYGKQRITVKGNMLGNNIDILRAYAIAGIGIIHTPEWLIRDDLLAGRLINLLPDWNITPSEMQEDAIYIVYPPNVRDIVKVGLLADFLQERLSNISV